VSKVLTPENREHVLPRFFHASKREAKVVSVALQPEAAAPRREVVTMLRVAAPAPALDLPGAAAGTRNRDDAAVHPDEPNRANDAPPCPAAPAAPARASRRDSTEPVTAELSRLHVTVARRFQEKLEAARAALSHAHPGANAEEILEAGLDLVLARHAKRKGLVEKPRKDTPSPASSRVPAHVKRAVWIRDGGRCQWPLDGGGVCGSTLRAELDHVVPRARGGPSTVENTRVLCRVHNDLAARRAFGDDWMDRFTRKRGTPRAAGRPSSRGDVLTVSCSHLR
jgi:hypothetical protein